jgi:hypothetical protein
LRFTPGFGGFEASILRIFSIHQYAHFAYRTITEAMKPGRSRSTR